MLIHDRELRAIIEIAYQVQKKNKSKVIDRICAYPEVMHWYGSGAGLLVNGFCEALEKVPDTYVTIDVFFAGSKSCHIFLHEASLHDLKKRLLDEFPEAVVAQVMES